MREIINFKEEKTFSKFLWSKSEVACHFQTKIRLTCDICGEFEEGEESVSIGVYTGSMKFPFFAKKMRELHWGFKNNSLVVCDHHTERQIESKIEVLKDAESERQNF